MQRKTADLCLKNGPIFAINLLKKKDRKPLAHKGFRSTKTLLFF